MPGLTKKKKIRRVLKQVADPEIADVLTTTEEFDEDEQTPIQFANAGLLGDVQRSSVDEGYLSPESLLQQQQDIALQTEGPLAQVQSQNLNPALYPTDPSLGLAGQDYDAGLPQEDITPEVVQIGDRFTTMEEMLDAGRVVYVDPDGTEVTMMDLVAETGLPIGRLGKVVNASKAMSPKWLRDLYAKILNRKRTGKPSKKVSDFAQDPPRLARKVDKGGPTAGPSGIVTPKTTARTGPSATTPGPNAGARLKLPTRTQLGALAPIVGAGIYAGSGGGDRTWDDFTDDIDPALKVATGIGGLLTRFTGTGAQEPELISPSGGVDPGIGPGGEPQKEKEIVDDAAGLLSIVDTELEGLTKGTGKLSHQPFVDKGEIQEVVDTGLNPERIYADFSQDIAGKRNRYLADLNEMYKKVAILNVIASLTNSPSQATAFMQLASEKFKALEGFADEERYQKIAQGVFFTEDGSFDAPKSKEEAFNRAIQFGATHDEAIKLSGHKAEPKTTTSGSYKTWHNPTTKQSVVMAPGQAPRGADGQVLEGWFPGGPDSGTEFERMKASALEAIQGGEIRSAIGDIAAWLLARDSMMRFSPEEATRAAEAMVTNWGAFGNMTEDEIDAYLEGATNIERTS